MALAGSISTSVSINSSSDGFYKLWKSQVYHLPNICPDHFQSIAIHEGDWHTDGAVKLWNYTIDGKALTVKEKVSFDDANKTVTFTIVDGDLLKEFKTIKSVVKVVPKGSGSTVTWTVEYEKLSESVATPYSYLVVYEKVTKDVDAHLLRG